MSEDNGRIEVGPCRCPGAIHGEDWVELHPDLTLSGGLAVAAHIGDNSGLSRLEVGPSALKALMRTEIMAWSFLDDDGKPVPVIPETIERMLPYAKGGAVVANAIVPRLAEASQTDPFKVRSTRRSSMPGQPRHTARSKASTSPSGTT
jgi:hypothetical protein